MGAKSVSIIRLSAAFDAERRRAIHKIKYNSDSILKIPQAEFTEIKRELTEEEKEQVFQRDNYTCLCCGKSGRKGKRTKLEVDHIAPFKLVGSTTLDNSQTLCGICNRAKNINEINFRVYKTLLPSPKDNLEIFNLSNDESMDCGLRRIINLFYHCHAVSVIRLSKKPGNKYRYHWEIQLYEGNDPEWLNKHKEKLIDCIRNEWKYEDLDDLTIK